MATVQIKKIKISAILGTKPQERTKKQDILLDISFEYDAENAILGDNVSQAVDYEQLAANIKDSISRTQFYLLEKLTHFALEIIFQDQKVISATVTAYKPKALKDAKHVSVTLSRKR